MAKKNNEKKTVYFLTGDIGGTNSRMFLYDSNSNTSTAVPLAFELFRNIDHISPDRYGDATVFQQCIIYPFLQSCWNNKKQQQQQYKLMDIENVEIMAVLAVAGVVRNNAVNVTNLGGMLVNGNQIAADQSSVYAKAICSCTIINDFVAQGYGCLTLQPSEVRHLYGSPKDVLNLPSGPKVCIGAGTGLGECYLTASSSSSSSSSQQQQYTCYPSEGGHVEYAPRHDLEVKMFQYLSHKFASRDRISVERVVSGIGLANIYEFLATEYPNRLDTTIHDEFIAAQDDKGRVVAIHVHDNDLCRQSMSIFMSAYGCEVGSAAIKWIPTGGLFVSGGLTPKNIEFIEGPNSDFIMSYLNKGRVSPLLETIPLFAVMVEDLGVRGAHKAVMMEYEQRSASSTSTSSTSTSFHLMSIQCWVGVAALAVASFGLGAIMMVRRRPT